MTNQSDKDFLLGKLGDLEALYAAIFLTLPEEVRERLLAEYMQEAKEGKGGVAADNSEDTMESLRAKLATSEAKLAASEEKCAALKEENCELKEAMKRKGTGSRVFPR